MLISAAEKWHLKNLVLPSHWNATWWWFAPSWKSLSWILLCWIITGQSQTSYFRARLSSRWWHLNSRGSWMKWIITNTLPCRELQFCLDWGVHLNKTDILLVRKSTVQVLINILLWTGFTPSHGGVYSLGVLLDFHCSWIPRWWCWVAEPLPMFSCSPPLPQLDLATVVQLWHKN